MKRQRSERRSAWLVWLASVAVLAGAGLYAGFLDDALRRPAQGTGLARFTLMGGLAAFNARKNLSMMPFARASTWLRLHFVGGILAVALLWLHTGTVWPQGRYEQALAGLFYLISLSGLMGYALQRIYPKQLTDTGVEIIFEKIPAELCNLREQAEAIVLAC